ncbi:MAG: histidine kinase dimerization/phospho-acceptor domain-containing protein [Candidatus Zixiibacteriota bacterium]
MTEKENKNLLKFEILRDLAIKINSLAGMREILSQALDKTIELVNLESGSIIIWDQKTKKQTDEVISGSVDKNQILMALEKDVLKNLREDFLVESVYLTLQKDGPLSFFSYPIRMNKKLVGVINGLTAGERSFPQEMDFLEALSHQLGLAVARTMYQVSLEELAEREKELEVKIEKEKLSMIKETAAGLNHEINNLLMSIVGNADLLLLTKDDLGSETIKRLRTIEETAMQIREIIQSLIRIIKPVTVDYPSGGRMLDIKKSEKEEKKEEEEEDPDR